MLREPFSIRKIRDAQALETVLVKTASRDTQLVGRFSVLLASIKNPAEIRQVVLDELRRNRELIYRELLQLGRD